jgi:hypothetical protein
MAPAPGVVNRDVFDLVGVVAPEVVGDRRVEAANRIEPVKQVDPATSYLLVGEPVIAAPLWLQPVLDLVEAERSAERDQGIDGHALGNALQAIIRDHSAEAVGNDNVRRRDHGRVDGRDKALADGLLDPHGRLAGRAELDIE